MEKIGFDKLLGKGKVLRKFSIKVKYASDKVAEKVKGSGGEISLTRELKEEDFSPEQWG